MYESTIMYTTVNKTGEIHRAPSRQLYEAASSIMLTVSLPSLLSLLFCMPLLGVAHFDGFLLYYEALFGYWHLV